MSKQQEAPGELEHVRAFVNTIDVEEGAEELTGPEELAAWLVQHGLARSGLVATTDDLEHALGLREALRAALLGHNSGTLVHADAASKLDRAAARARLRLRFDEQGSGSVQPEADGVDGALGRLLAIVHRSATEGTWSRLNDHTRNRAGTWCTMAVCGNRAKARAYRERRGAPRGMQG